MILLIDEYDVPLDKAHINGYYDQMVAFLRGFFGEAFKTNPDLFFAVVTGCLRISKESIFTGINNLKVDTITDTRYDEYFGFTEADVKSCWPTMAWSMPWRTCGRGTTAITSAMRTSIARGM